MPDDVPLSKVSTAVIGKVKPVCDQCLGCKIVIVKIAKPSETSTSICPHLEFTLSIKPGVPLEPPE